MPNCASSQAESGGPRVAAIMPSRPFLRHLFAYLRGSEDKESALGLMMEL
jgi:hypothetical protein